MEFGPIFRACFVNKKLRNKTGAILIVELFCRHADGHAGLRG